ncbi:hypothetical protein [Draconibacterium halophilum]|uniref:Uncharacterized protein n=1 Tax=Draconibacterium halophilum TaxID=2706887 RepID=A0A6C0R9N6_9BACT|nr:hypothetical protein [Draconibacterium halophilum]QIA07238.1 hypothetical protein G0Q07_05640 [Draconibacterium halophilum]
MAIKLKRDQLPAKKAENWKNNFKEESEKTFNLKLSPIILQKETYKSLIGDNENRLRVYLGLETDKDGDRYVLCAFAVSAFLLGSGDVYADYETPVFKLNKVNEDFTNNTDAVIKSVRLYRQWRAGELDETHEGAAFRQYIYPKAYLLTKFELHELFNTQNRDKVKIELGIKKTMDVMVSADSNQMPKSVEDGGGDDDIEEYNSSGICPPFCDERSIYNS